MASGALAGPGRDAGAVSSDRRQQFPDRLCRAPTACCWTPSPTPAFRNAARTASIRPGTLWSEALRGTNALGTVARTGQKLTVHGGEHFFAHYGSLTCTAAPVHRTRWAWWSGVLDASSHCGSRQQHTQALVGMAATQIENGLFRQHHRGNLIITFHSRGEYLAHAQRRAAGAGPRPAPCWASTRRRGSCCRACRRYAEPAFRGSVPHPLRRSDGRRGAPGFSAWRTGWAACSSPRCGEFAAACQTTRRRRARPADRSPRDARRRGRGRRRSAPPCAHAEAECAAAACRC